jgi:hypothetical protein
VAWLLLAGISRVWSEVSRVARWLGARLRPGAGPGSNSYIIPWGVWLWTVSLSLFTLYCLVALIIPYYYK